MVFKSIMKYCERKFNIDYILDLIATPKYGRDEITILKDNEKTYYNSLKTIGIIICLNTGMRIGEICALTRMILI